MRGSAFSAEVCIPAFAKGGSAAVAAMPMRLLPTAVNYAEQRFKYQCFCVCVPSKRDIHAG
jgi:hypothetical protein